jgi:RNA polymerase sigma factor (sigma-70 family)
MTEIDQDLLERARRGDRQAHATLYRAFAPMIYTLACRMLGSRSLAEDVLQDSFVEVIRKADQFRGQAAIGAWIKRIAINKCLTLLRSPWTQRRIAGVDCEQARFAGRDTAPDGGTETQAALSQALAKLSAPARAVVWLHDVEGYTHDEIGRLMGQSTSFSKSQLARAYRQLRAILDPETQPAETTPCLGALKTI